MTSHTRALFDSIDRQLRICLSLAATTAILLLVTLLLSVQLEAQLACLDQQLAAIASKVGVAVLP